jgi:hypothetical protein
MESNAKPYLGPFLHAKPYLALFPARQDHCAQFGRQCMAAELKLRFRRLIVLISDQLKLLSVVRGGPPCL